MPGRSHRKTQRKNATLLGPIAFARAYRTHRLFGIATLAVLGLLIAVFDHGLGLLPVDDDWHRYHGQSFEVVRVVDGDTLDLRTPDGDSAVTRVRLWGVDTPEIAHPERDQPAEPFADEATDFTRGLVEGQRVELRLQRHRVRGRFGRVLAYVVLPDGRELNSELLSAGLARFDDRWSHDQTPHYADLEREARERAAGIWSE